MPLWMWAISRAWVQSVYMQQSGVYVDVFNLSGAIFKDWVWLPERDRLRIVERVQQSWWPSSAGVLRRHRCNTGWWRHHALRQLNVNYASALSVHPLKHHNHPPTCPLLSTTHKSSRKNQVTTSYYKYISNRFSPFCYYIVPEKRSYSNGNAVRLRDFWGEISAIVLLCRQSSGHTRSLLSSIN